MCDSLRGDSRRWIGWLAVTGMILCGIVAQDFMVATLGHDQRIQAGTNSDAIEFYRSLTATFNVHVIGFVTIPLQPVPLTQRRTLDETLKGIAAQQGNLSWRQIAPDLLAVGPVKQVDRQVKGYLQRARDVILQRAQGLRGFLDHLEPRHRQFLQDNWFLSLKDLNPEERIWLLAALNGESDVASLSDRLKESWQAGWRELQDVRILLVFWPVMSVIGQDGYPLSEEVALALPQHWHDMSGYEMPDRLQAWRQQVGWQAGSEILSVGRGKSGLESKPPTWKIAQEISEERFKASLARSIKSIPLNVVVTFETPLSTLGDIVKTFSQQVGKEVYVEAREASTEMYITPGTYRAADFMVALVEASGLAPREVGSLLFLSSAAGPLSATELKLLRGAAYADRRQFWWEHLGFLIPPKDLLLAVGSVFPPQWLQYGKEVPWTELSPAQRWQVESSFPGLRTSGLEGGCVVFSPGFMLRSVGLVEEYVHPHTGLPFRSYVGSSRLFY